MMRAKHKSLALAGLLGLAMTLASGCYYYDHDDHWRYGRRYDDRYYRYDRYRDGYYSRYDRDRDYRWGWDRDRYYNYSSRQSNPMRDHYND
jgi:hypothetical protein